MFTVIFADTETIKLFEETKMFFGPLYDSEQITFCEWDKSAPSFDRMVQGLSEKIEFQKEWRAVVLYDDGFEKHNPFDFTGYSEPYYSDAKRDWDYYKNRRAARLGAYEKAVSNPLVKLSTALCGIQGVREVLAGDEYQSLLSGELTTCEYMLKKQLEALDCSKTAARFDRYQREDLRRYVAEENVDRLISCIRERNVQGITEMISDTQILGFIRFIGNDPIYYDPEYTECLIEDSKKRELRTALADNFSMKDKLPSEVICISPRTFDFESIKPDIKWKEKDELSSSRFADFNLYVDNMKFIVFDIIAKDNAGYRFDYIKFMALVLVMANNELPSGYVTHNNVYRAELDFDDRIVERMCERYISKLKATQILLKEISIELDRNKEDSVDSDTAQRLFESDIHIPVSIPPEHSESELYAKYKSIGLSSDCPVDEEHFWSGQYRNIIKRFIRYLREPRRAVKTAVSEGLRKSNYIYDDRTLLLSEDQIDDVKFHIAELEQKMVEATTTKLYDTKKFTDELQKADKVVKRGIEQRMTKRKTVTVALIAVLAYFIGFLPLVFSAVNSIKSFVFSLAVTSIVMGIFLIIGFITLFFLRRKLVNRFKHFNYVMSGICSRIRDSLVGFSTYITHVCNLMRDFSVLKKHDSEVAKTKKILVYHNMKLEEQVKEAYEMFSQYVDFNKVSVKEAEPYDYDYTKLADYRFEMPGVFTKKKIKFLQLGSEVTVPVDYINAVTLTREELYD